MTPTETFVLQELQLRLAPGESILAMAYVRPTMSSSRVGVFVDAATKMAAFVALTNSRILFLQTRIGAFTPLLENHGIVEVDRRRVRAVYVKDQLFIELENSPPIVYDVVRSAKQLPSEQELYRLLTASYPRSELGAKSAPFRLPLVYALLLIAAGIIVGVVSAWMHGNH